MDAKLAGAVADRPELPDRAVVLRSVDAWAEVDGALAGWLRAGVSPGEALRRWGLQLLGGGRVSDAVTALRASAALGPDDAASWTSFGVALDRAGTSADAGACFEQSLALDPNQPDTWLLLGLAKKKQGDAAGSEAAYRSALTLAPQLDVAWQCLALLKDEQRDHPAAILAFEACARHGSPSAAISANLGRLYYQVGRARESRVAYEAAAHLDGANLHYRQMVRKARLLEDLIEADSVDAALATYDATRESAGADVESVLDVLEGACGHLTHIGRVDAATRVAEKRVTLAPDSVAARYVLGALRGEPGIDRSPREYLVESFDAFALGFDAKLVGVLGYDIPEKLCEVVRALTPPGHLYDAVDAGCGTGLCGPLVRPLARSLVGVDLSPKMLDEARRRGPYDALVCDDLAAFLGRSEGRFDLAVAADVVIYFGELATLFAGAARAIAPGGLFVFSAETLRGASTTGYTLQPSGRFAHAPSYVRAVAAEGFVEARFVETTIRLEGRERVPGAIFALRRR